MSESTKKSAGLKHLPKMSNPHTHRYKVHNKAFASDNAEFLTACQAADVKPTARQASKFRNKRGRAYVGA